MADNDGRDIGYGTIVKVSSVTTTTSSTAAGLSTVGSLIDFGGFTNPIPRIDTSTIADAADTCAPGTPAAGAGTLTLGYRQGDAGQNKLIKMNKNRTVGKFWIVYASTGLVDESIKGYVADVGKPVAGKADRMQRNISIQPTSAIGWSTG